MNRIIFFSFVSLFIMSFTQFNNKRQLTNLELKYLKDNYKWKSEEILIINFRHRNENCFYDNNGNLNSSNKWWKKFYSKIDLNNTYNIYVYSDRVSSKTIIDTVTRFEDYDEFLLNNFFNFKKECYGVLVVNSKGEYEVHEGEYSEELVKDFITILKK